MTHPPIPWIERLALRRLPLGLNLAGLMLLVPLAWPTRLLLAWSVGAMVYLSLAWSLALRLDAHRTRARALALDPPGWLAFSMAVLSMLASVAAIAMLLTAQVGPQDAVQALHMGLALLALAAAWVLIHTLFAFRYAHMYYHARWQPAGAAPALLFPGGEAPDYADFLYYALVVGMTSQVSDVQVQSRSLRRLTLVQSVLAFVFNMFVLALGINVLAGLLH